MILALLASCNEHGKRNLTAVSIDYETLDTIDFWSSSVFSEVMPVYLDTSGNIFGSLLFLKMKQDKFYFLDKQQMAVFVFDQTGNFVNKIARPGRGPGEYT